MTQTAVNVEDVSVSILSGEAEIKSFFLGNPKGFKSTQAMKVGSVAVDIDEDTITKDPIVINKIEIIAPEITYEKISGSDNFQALLNNIKQSVKSEKSAEVKTAQGEEKAGKKIIIDNVIIKDGKVNLTMAALAGKTITAPLPDIHLKDIGREKKGATPAEAFEKIFASLYSSINADSVTQVFNEGLKQFGDLKSLGVEGVKTGEEAAKQAVDTATKSVESVGKEIDTATEGLKNLFKKE